MRCSTSTGFRRRIRAARTSRWISPTTARPPRRCIAVDDKYDGVDAVVHLAAIPAPA